MGSSKCMGTTGRMYFGNSALSFVERFTILCSY